MDFHIKFSVQSIFLGESLFFYHPIIWPAKSKTTNSIWSSSFLRLNWLLLLKGKSVSVKAACRHDRESLFFYFCLFLPIVPFRKNWDEGYQSHVGSVGGCFWFHHLRNKRIAAFFGCCRPLSVGHHEPTNSRIQSSVGRLEREREVLAGMFQKTKKKKERWK